MQCLCCRIPEYLDKTCCESVAFKKIANKITNQSSKVVCYTQSIRDLKKLFTVATDTGLELPVPKKGSKVSVTKEKLVPSCGLQDRASLHSPWIASSHQSVTRVIAKPAQQLSPEGPGGSNTAKSFFCT